MLRLLVPTAFQAGAARARSLALYENDTPPDGWILTIDADDVLLPETLNLLEETITEFPDAHWVAGGILKPDGVTATLGVDDAPWLGPNPEGFPEVPSGNWLHLPPLIPAGWTPPERILDSMAETGWFPIFAAVVAYRADTVWRAGGWPGTPTGEDAALLARISDTHPGVVRAEPFSAYRQHEGQNTQSTWHAANKAVTWRMVHASRPGKRGETKHSRALTRYEVCSPEEALGLEKDRP